jgi:hypothetical protein
LFTAAPNDWLAEACATKWAVFSVVIGSPLHPAISTIPPSSLAVCFIVPSRVVWVMLYARKMKPGD